MTIAVLGGNSDKNSFSLIGLDASRRVVLSCRMRCETIVRFCAALPSCIVVMEACCYAHHITLVAP